MKQYQLLIVTFLIAVFLGGGCSRKGEVVIARVGDEEITADDVVEIMGGGGYADNLDGLKEALDHLVDFRLLLEAAREEGLDTTAEFRKDFKVMKENFVVRKLYEEVVVKSAGATDQELRDYFDKQKLGDEQVEARHILVMYKEGDGEEKRKEALAKAEKVLAEAKAGADFAELARKHSEGPDASNGGYLGFFPRGKMVKPFEDAIFALKPGEVSGVVETRFGFHIVKVENKRTRTFEEMRDEIRAYVEQPKRQKMSRDFMKDLETGAAIAYHDDAIDTLIAKLGRAASSNATAANSDVVLATYNGGEWTMSRYLDFYSDFPDDYKSAPRDRDEVKAILKSLIRNELLIEKAKQTGIDSKPEFQKELTQLEDDALVQIFIKRNVYIEPELSEDELKAHYESHKETYTMPFEEMRDLVKTDLVDEKRQKRLDEITMPLKEKFKVVLLENNFPTVLDQLKKKS